MTRRRRFGVAVLVAAAATTTGAATPLSELRASFAELLGDRGEGDAIEGFPFLECFRDASRRHDVPLPLLIGLAWGESAFDPTARSSKNAIGIMQIRWPGTAGDLGFESVESLEDPCRNIRAGARYLRQLLDRVEGDTVLALASYNHGPNAIDGRDGNMNDHARWYVRYIHDKTAAVMAGRTFVDGDRLLRLGRFTDYGMARVSLERYRRLARTRDNVELDLSVQRNAEGKYDLRVACRTVEDLDVERSRYERITGFVPR